MGVNEIKWIALSLFVFMFFSVKMSGVYQQCSYRLGEFFSAIFCGTRAEISKLSTYSLIFLAVLVILCPFLEMEGALGDLISLNLCIPFCGLYFFSSKSVKGVNFTKRFIRLYVTSALIIGALCFLFALLIDSLCLGAECMLIYIGIIPLALILVIPLGGIVNYPLDKIIYVFYKARCRLRLRKNPDLTVIGITGSMGKTSVKNYLYKMLSQKYRVLVTPHSYNTPMGVCMSVKKDIKNYEIFIVEMGARRKNDIKELCKMVRPSIGIITGITNQHGKTLNGIEGIKNAKYQLIEGLCGQKLAFFSSDSEGAEELYLKAQCEKHLVGINGKRIYAREILQGEDGISFTIYFGGKEYKTCAPMIGEHTVTNICIASAVAFRLGVGVGKILSVIPTLTPPPHRASVIKASSGLTVIDDGYNANLEGVRSTANAIKSFSGYKIAVTAGIVELGKSAEEVNKEVGRVLAEVFDEVVCVGINARFIESGVNEFDKRSTVVGSRAEAQAVLEGKRLSSGVVAFFNDLPDKYQI